ncbi:MAG: DNA gyrase inhibitor YacG [Pseudomonadota bacterium]
MATCPICRKKEATADFKPFCSKRCADIDLGRWFNGGYAIQTEEPAPISDIVPDAAND